MKKPWEVTDSEIYERYPGLYANPFADDMDRARRIIEKEKKREYVFNEIEKLWKEIRALKK